VYDTAEGWNIGLSREGHMAPFETKDVVTVCMSVVSLLVASTSFVLSYSQRAKQDKITARKALTDTMAALADVNLSFAKLKLERPVPSDDVMALRRVYNSQRRYLAKHAEFLLGDIPELATDIDHSILAGAFESMQDFDRAELHWRESIDRSPAEGLRAINLRGYARFLFYQGNPQLGRRRWEESLQVQVPDNDSNRRLRADTYALWSVTEKQLGFREEALRRRDQAVGEANRIGHPLMKAEILRYIDDLWSEPSGPAAAPGQPPSA
jgi:tetratricopeptide (TPR) repeat protein